MAPLSKELTELELASALEEPVSAELDSSTVEEAGAAEEGAADGAADGAEEAGAEAEAEAEAEPAAEPAAA